MKTTFFLSSIISSSSLCTVPYFVHFVPGEEMEDPDISGPVLVVGDSDISLIFPVQRWGGGSAEISSPEVGGGGGP